MIRFVFILVILAMASRSFTQSRQQQADALYQEALKAYRKRELNSASIQIEEALNLAQKAEYHYLNGMILESMKKDLRAASSYEAALQLDPHFDEALFQKSLIYLNYGNPSQAVKDLTMLIDRGGVRTTRGVYFETDAASQRGTAITTLATLQSKLFYYRGQAYSEQGNYQVAIDDFNNAIQLDSLGEYFVGRGLTYQKMKNDPLAINDYKWAISLDSTDQIAWYNLALIYPDVELPDELLEDNTFGPTLSLLASEAMTERRYESAIRYLTQAIVNEEEPLHFINRGRAYVKIGAFEKARSDFQAARKMDPSRFECFYLIGNTYFYERNHKLAVTYYNQYLTVNPKNAMVWYNGAMSYLELDEEMDACHFLNQANNLGMVQAREMINQHCR